MGRNSNPNQKPIALKRELSGAEKAAKRKAEEKKRKMDSMAASIFFKLQPSGSAGSCMREPKSKIDTASQVVLASPPLETVSSASGFIEPPKAATGSTTSIIAVAEQVDIALASEPVEPDGDVNIINSEAADETAFDLSDPSTWNVPMTSHQHAALLSHSPIQATLRKFPRNGARAFNPKNYVSQGGVSREWLLYSKTTHSLFCFSCCLFPSSTSSLSPWISYGNGRAGFTTFEQQSRGIKTHEKSQMHFDSTITWKQYEASKKAEKNLNQVTQKQVSEEISIWKQVLHGILKAIVFLAKNSLAFQGTSTKIGEPDCGNFLSLVELLSKYYSPLAIHVSRIKSNNSRTTYMSHRTQNEFIEITARCVRSTILDSVRRRKYFSIMFDATPDVSHNEQISQVVRSVELSESGCQIEEHFIVFIHFDLKTGHDIAQVILKKLADDGLDIQDCRGQGYDNGSNMAGVYKGVQARIREVNPKAIFLPCVAHSLNLVGQHAASKVLPGKSLLGQIQNLYTFFSSSPMRWNVLKIHVKKTLKCQSSTRWSCKADAVAAVVEEFHGLTEALLELSASENSNAHTMAEASALFGLIHNFKFLLGANIWKTILDRINTTSKLLQAQNCRIDDAAGHLEGLVLWFVEEYRENGFDDAYEKSKVIAATCGIDEKSGFDTRVNRGYKPARFRDDSCADKEVLPLQKFKTEFYDKVMDTLIEEFRSRFKAIETTKNSFDFLWGVKLASYSAKDLVECAKTLTSTYKGDLKPTFSIEIGYLRTALTPFLHLGNLELKETTAMDVLNVLLKHHLRLQFENTVTALQIFLTLPVTVATNERSFSKLKLIKNHLRSTMGQQRLSDLSILSIEHDTLKNTSFDKVISDFANAKCRRVTI